VREQMVAKAQGFLGQFLQVMEYEEAKRRAVRESSTISRQMTRERQAQLAAAIGEQRKASGGETDTHLDEAPPAEAAATREVVAEPPRPTAEGTGSDHRDAGDDASEAQTSCGGGEHHSVHPTAKQEQRALRWWEARQVLYDPLEPLNWRTVANLGFKYADDLDLPDECVIRIPAVCRACAVVACVRSADVARAVSRVFRRTKKRLLALYGEKETQDTGTRVGNEGIFAPHRYNLARIAELQAAYDHYRDHPVAFFPRKHET
jgi:hypothetical protein